MESQRKRDTPGQGGRQQNHYKSKEVSLPPLSAPRGSQENTSEDINHRLVVSLYPMYAPRELGLRRSPLSFGLYFRFSFIGK